MTIYASTYAKIIEDSIAEESGVRLTTFELRFPRIILAENNTHRKFSRNTSSSRAIPVKKLLNDVRTGMFIPSYWGKNQSGMQAREELSGWRKSLAIFIWKMAGHTACNFASLLSFLGVHKQITNRLIEPFSYVTVCLSSTDWANFLTLRNHPDAQPEINILAGLMQKALVESIPVLRGTDKTKVENWHLPYVTQVERTTQPLSDLILTSVARCASTSYKTVDGKEMTTERALILGNKLLLTTPLHASPAEHQAYPDVWRINKTVPSRWVNPKFHGNFTGWIQYRKTLPNEYVQDPGRLKGM